MMTLIKNAFSSLSAAATARANKLLGVTKAEGELAMEAAALVAMADGVLQQEEQDKTEDLIESRPELVKIGIYELVKHFQATVNQAKVSQRMTKREVLERLRKVTNATSRERILILAIEIADSSGGIGEAEEKILNEIAASLSLRLADFL